MSYQSMCDGGCVTSIPVCSTDVLEKGAMCARFIEGILKENRRKSLQTCKTMSKNNIIGFIEDTLPLHWQ